MTISQKLFMILDKKHISQKNLADSIGVPASTVSAWKNNNSSPPIEKLIDISKVLDVPVEVMLDESEDFSADISISGQPVESQNIFGNDEIMDAYQNLSLKQKLRVQVYITELAEEDKYFI